MSSSWEAVIGLEVHIQLLTASKIFSGASTDYGALPNTQACLIDLAIPGTLPVLNEVPVRMAIKLGLAIHAELAKTSVFARKNYFYPDLPKGYQISQHLFPIVKSGYLDVDFPDHSTKRIGISRAHLEEDSGKSLHADLNGMTGIDLNRAGVPLLEIVSEPDLRSPEEAVAYLKTLHTLVRYLDICDGNMQEGSFRCDANISVRPQGETRLGVRTEIKNMNSFRFIERAIQYEIQRQITCLSKGEPVVQETRLYDSVKNETRPMRTKEDSHDYRYFPDPDLLPLVLTDEMITSARDDLPELPREKFQRFIKQYNLSAYDASLLSLSRDTADYFEQVMKLGGVDAKLVANWMLGELSAALNKHHLTIAQSAVSVEQMHALLRHVQDKTLSHPLAKTVWEALWNQEGSVDQIIAEKGLKPVTETSFLETLIDQVLENNPNEREAYRAGKVKLFGFFVGQVMQLSQGKASPQHVNELLKMKLNQ